jgi:hypothetical protein
MNDKKVRVSQQGEIARLNELGRVPPGKGLSKSCDPVAEYGGLLGGVQTALFCLVARQQGACSFDRGPVYDQRGQLRFFHLQKAPMTSYRHRSQLQLETERQGFTERPQ